MTAGDDECGGACKAAISIWAAGVAAVLSGIGFGVWWYRTQNRRGARVVELPGDRSEIHLAFHAEQADAEWWAAALPKIIVWFDGWMAERGYLPFPGFWAARCHDARFEVYDLQRVPDPTKFDKEVANVRGLYLGQYTGAYRPFTIRTIPSTHTVVHELYHAFEHLVEGQSSAEWNRLNNAGQHFGDVARWERLSLEARRADADGLFG